jgi:acyl dehydratase
MSEVVYWEDLVRAPVRRFGPLTFPTELLDHLLDLMGEKHPIHDDPAFAARAKRTRQIVPGGFIHSITSGYSVQHGGRAAIVGMRSMHWDFVRPLYPDVPFYFTTETLHTEEIDERVGLVNSVRRVVDEADRAFAIARLSVVMLRRSAVPRMEAKVL